MHGLQRRAEPFRSCLRVKHVVLHHCHHTPRMGPLVIWTGPRETSSGCFPTTLSAQVPDKRAAATRKHPGSESRDGHAIPPLWPGELEPTAGLKEAEPTAGHQGTRGSGCWRPACLRSPRRPAGGAPKCQWAAGGRASAGPRPRAGGGERPAWHLRMSWVVCRRAKVAFCVIR